ncbi:MAG: hypothetical protein ACXVCO_05145 [Ktedonobacterales bacterium]
MERVPRPVIFGGILAAVIAVVFFVLATIFGWWPVVLDIVLVGAALLSAVLLGALVYAVLQLTRTVVDVKNEIMPVLNSLQTTSNAAREAAKTATVFGVDPAVRTAGMIAGAGQVASVVLGRGQAIKRSEQRQKRRVEIEREMAARGELNGNR